MGVVVRRFFKVWKACSQAPYHENYALLQELGHGLGNSGEVLNELVVVSCKSKKTSDVGEVLRLPPI